jgi:hypothetical protein
MTLACRSRIRKRSSSEEKPFGHRLQETGAAMTLFFCLFQSKTFTPF